MNRRTFLQAAVSSGASLAALSSSKLPVTEAAAQATGTITIEAPNLLVFREGRQQLMRNAYVTIEGTRISDISSTRPARTGELIHASSQHLVMPGLIDAHSHTCTGIIVRGEVENGWTDTNSIWLPFEYTAKLDSQEQIDALNQWAILEVLKAGTTTVLDSSLNVRFARSFAVAAEKMGIRTYVVPFLPGMHRIMDVMFRWDNQALEKSTPGTERELEQVVDLIRTYNSKPDGLVRVGLGPEEGTNVTATILKKIGELAQQLDCIIGMHPTSQGGDKRVVQMYGKSMIPFLHDIGLLGDRLILYQGGGNNEEDLKLVAKSGTSVAYDQFSHLYRAPMRSSYLPKKRAGINMALGSNSLMMDLVEQMKWIAFLTQIYEQLWTHPYEEELVSMATDGGARALRRPDLGRLEKDARADIIIVNLGKPHNGPITEKPLRNLVYYSSGADVETVIVNGKVLIRDGKTQFPVDPKMASIVQGTKAQIWQALGRDIKREKKYPGMREPFEEWQEMMRRKAASQSG